MDIANFLRIALPYANMLLVIAVVTLLIKILLTKNELTYVTPWKFLLFSLLAYIVEEILTIIDIAGIVAMPKIIFPIIESVIICSFIYMILIQKRYVDMQS